MESWWIEIEKDYLKFSAAHFLIFPDGTAERLHGHNYKVYVDVEAALDEHGLVLNFKEIKPLVKELVDELDEHLIVPTGHPVLTATERGDTLEVRYQERLYVVPRADAVLLPINNSSAENLATWLGGELCKRLRASWPGCRLRRIQMAVEETPGQRGVYCWTA